MTFHTRYHIICNVIVQPFLYHLYNLICTSDVMSRFCHYPVQFYCKWTSSNLHYDLTYHILHHMYRDSASSFVPFLQPPFVPVMSHRIRVVTQYKWVRSNSHYDPTYHILHHMYCDSAISFVPVRHQLLPECHYLVQMDPLDVAL